jgi:hypothetical protein
MIAMRRFAFYAGMLALAAVIELALLYAGEQWYGGRPAVTGALR